MTDAALQGGCRWCGQVIDPNMQAHAIVQEVADEHRVPVDDVYRATGSRKAYIVAARACAIRRISSEAGLTQTAIGELFGLERTTVLHHLNGGNGTGERAAATSRQAQD